MSYLQAQPSSNALAPYFTILLINQSYGFTNCTGPQAMMPSLANQLFNHINCAQVQPFALLHPLTLQLAHFYDQPPQFYDLNALHTDQGLKVSQDQQPTCSKSQENKPNLSKPVKGKLNFCIEWKNSYRNIVPNLMNQLISFLCKPIKSGRIVARALKMIRRDASQEDADITAEKYYLYVKMIKDSVSHYVTEKALEPFLRMADCSCRIYPFFEQQCYLRVLRTVIASFFRNESILISLTSKKMNDQKRRLYLIAKEALRQRFQHLLLKLRN